jgi:hypothetical protein
MNAISAPLTPAVVRRPTRIRIWVPLLLLLVLLSPILLLLAMMGAVVLQAKGLPPGRTLLAIARVVLALPGARVQVEAPDASVHIIIF